MIEVCGFKGLDGKFYEKASECEIADLRLKVDETRRKLENFPKHMSDQIYRKTWYANDDLIVNHQSITKYAHEFVMKCVLDDSDMFISIIKEKRAIAKHLSKLKSAYDKQKDNHKWGYAGPWWMQFIWWNKKT
jgi:hypothetical protein|tara:strand:+ start:751 stop:1149 length:399 start_codon:yes stop_codon:yes gene_type:complete